MQTALHIQEGKPQWRSAIAATDNHATSGRLFVKDRASGLDFLIDTGSDLSVFPRSLLNKRPRTNYQLYAANGSIINTYGWHTVSLKLGLRRDFTWRFIVADVTKPIIGVDFLSHFSLLVDTRNQRLVDGITSLTAAASVSKQPAQSVKTISGDSSSYPLLAEFPELTRPSGVQRDIKHSTVHHIRTTPGPPVSSRPRRLDPERLSIAKAEFAAMLNNGTVRRSESPWSSALHLVPKRDNGWRPCGDYRQLNARTIPDSYPVRLMGDFAHQLAGCTVFSTLDLVKAYNQIPVNKEDVPKTAITTPFGLFEFPYMSFGLRNAAQTFQRFIDEVTRDLDFCFPYIDDLLIASTTTEEHEEHLRLLFQRLADYGILLNAAKCVFAASEVTFLGYRISAQGTRPLEDRVAAIQSYTLPQNVRQLRRFLGMLNFYHRFLPTAAMDQAPLNALLSGKVHGTTVISWTPELVAAFDKCKAALSTSTLLAHPERGAHLAVVTDASGFAMGAALQQHVDGAWQPLAFFSRKLSPTQQKYSPYDRELLAIYSAVRHFRHMLEARHFTIFTDHKPIAFAYAQRRDNCSPRQFRHLDFIAQFTTDIRHISGQHNVVADALSRVEVEAVQQPIDFTALALEQEHDTELQEQLAAGTPLQLEKIDIPGTEASVYCDVSTSRPRPYITPSFRRQVFNVLHGLSHPGIRATLAAVSRRFVWPGMNRDCRDWSRACLQCQRSKITRHVHSPFGNFKLPEARFLHVHLDLIGPMPSSDGCRYCLTAVDRFTRWPEATPLSDITAETVARAFFHIWISRFGCPLKVTTDQGRQFEAQLFRALLQLCGAQLQHTTAYHPEANGMVERLHRTLKAALMCHQPDTWTEALPLVLLGLRTALKPDVNSSAAELVYGEQLRVPGEFLTPAQLPDSAEPFLSTLRRRIATLRPTAAARHTTQKTFVFKDLATATHVFLRSDFARSSLEPPYTGPYEVVSRNDKTFKIIINNKAVVVTIDRLKPAYILQEDAETPQSPTPSEDSSGGRSPTPEPVPSRTTRAGRQVHFPDFYSA